MEVLDLQEVDTDTGDLSRQKNYFICPRWLWRRVGGAGPCFPWTHGLWRWWYLQAWWQHHGTGLEERKWGHAETLGSEFIACHNFISVAVTNCPMTKQLKGKEFIWNMIPGCSPWLQEAKAGTQAASHITSCQSGERWTCPALAGWFLPRELSLLFYDSRSAHEIVPTFKVGLPTLLTIRISLYRLTHQPLWSR